MKPRTIILLVVAVVCGLAAMYMTNRLLADKGTPPPVATVKVLLSKQKIAAWNLIKKPEDLFEVKEVPDGTYSNKCLGDLKLVQDKALKHPLDAQLPITPDDLANEATSGLFFKLHDGQRAIAIRVTPESLAGGFVLPDSKVDVMWIKKRGDGDSESQIILQNMLVLAVDMKKVKDAESDAMLGSTATLAVTPEEAEQLALAQSLGDLRLLLRQPDDTANAKYKPVGIDQIGRQRRPGDPNQPGATDVETASAGNSGGYLPTIKAPEVKPAPAPAPAPAEEKVAEAPKPWQYQLQVENGDTQSSFLYTWDSKTNRWLKDAPAKAPEAAAAPDAPKPQPPAAGPDKGPVG